MKKYLLVTVGGLVAVTIVVVLISSTMPLFAKNKAAAHALAVGQGTVPPAESSGAAPDGIVAEAVVVPVQYAMLSMPAGGIVAAVLAEEGDVVEAGQVILRLQDVHQRAAVAQAEAALARARAQLAALEAGPRNQEITAAQASLDAARARLARLNEGARPDEIVAAKATLQAAQASLQRLYEGPDQQARIAAEADLANAEAALHQAQAAYDQVAGRSDVAMLPQSLTLQQATNLYDAAQARYDALFAAPKADLVAGAEAQVKQAQAAVDRLLAPATENEIAEAEAMVRQAQAQVDLLKAGARDEEIGAAAAAVAEAEAALEQVQATLADTELKAPFAGTLAALNVKEGEQVIPGSATAELADLAAWQVETDDLTELDVVHVKEGDRVKVSFDAIENLELPGTVVRIKPMGQEKLGDITYTVVIRLDEQDSRLRWNMTAVVTVP
jgi:multidrug efflux pump subunit AcrA (membrane-fusion protein)